MKRDVCVKMTSATFVEVLKSYAAVTQQAYPFIVYLKFSFNSAWLECSL